MLRRIRKEVEDLRAENRRLANHVLGADRNVQELEAENKLLQARLGESDESGSQS
jgi:FtsZ-binding cell division protein ZapB